MAGISLLLALVTLAVYLPGVRHDFLTYDDQQYVTENPHVLSGLSWANFKWAFQAGYASNWHPLTWLSHMLDCQIFGARPMGHHLTNVLLHVANVLLLFLGLRRLTGATGRSAVVAALFAWHPLHVESVAWVAERKDLLCACFWMLTLLAYARYASKPGAVRYLVTLGCFSLGLLSKPMIVTLPFVLLLLDYWPLRRTAATRTVGMPRQPWPRLALEKVPFLVLTVIASWLTIWAQRQAHSIVSLQGLPLAERLLHVPIAYAHYLQAMFLPWGLAVYYPFPAASSPIPGGGCAVLLLLVSAGAWWWAGRRPYLLVGWCWYLGTLVPVIGFVQVGDQAWADRYTYLPLIGPFIALVWLAGDWGMAAGRSGNSAGKRVWLGLELAGLGVALILLTERQLGFWQDTRTLFTQAVRVVPENAKAITLLGSLLVKEGKVDEAMGLYDRALKIRPDDPEAHFFRGNALERKSRLDEAIVEYRRALWFEPLAAKTHFFLGGALVKQQQYEAAVAEYREALRRDPDSAVTHNNLARVFHTRGRFEEAAVEYGAALRLEPAFPQAHNNLGIVLLQTGQLGPGIAELREALRLTPGNGEIAYNLAVALNQQEHWREAAELFGPVVPPGHPDPKAHFEFGRALEHTGKTREALARLARALIQQPDYPAALNELAWILVTDPRAEIRNGAEAVPMAERAVELSQGKNPAWRLTLAAAYAEVGRFPEAVTSAQSAADAARSAGQNELLLRCGQVLAAAQAGKPWRETLAQP